MLNEDTKKAWEDMLYFTKWLSESHWFSKKQLVCIGCFFRS
jgi:hypothetical protein